MSDAPTEEGRATVETIARHHDLPADAAMVLLAAIRRGGGRQAQFSHPALGGMGQWSRGGGTMIGDMFDHALKAKVERLCEALADHAGDDRLFAGNAQDTSGGDWWPRHLGRPSAVGSQNEQGYACFPEMRRLAIRDADVVRIFDTADHRITGVSQQQSGARDLRFTSQHGTVCVADLTPVADEPMQVTTEPAENDNDAGMPPRSRATARSADGGADVLALLERLYELQRKGILTQEEYSAKKTELLARL